MINTRIFLFYSFLIIFFFLKNITQMKNSKKKYINPVTLIFDSNAQAMDTCNSQIGYNDLK